MAQVITVRQIDAKLHDALRQRAARTGRSVEGEVRAILTEVCVHGGDAAGWVGGLRDRARRRTGSTPQTDSADLLREMRDAR